MLLLLRLPIEERQRAEVEAFEAEADWLDGEEAALLSANGVLNAGTAWLGD